MTCEADELVHVALNTVIEPDGTQRQILRENMPFGTLGTGEFGTYFVGYAANPLGYRADAPTHVLRGSSWQLRPDPRLLNRGDRAQPVLRTNLPTSLTTSSVLPDDAGSTRSPADDQSAAPEEAVGRPAPRGGRGITRDRRAQG